MNTPEFYTGPLNPHIFSAPLREYLNNMDVYTFNQLMERLPEVDEAMKRDDPELFDHINQILKRINDIWEKCDNDEKQILPPEMHRGTLLADLGISTALSFVLFRMHAITVGDLLDYEKGFTLLFNALKDSEFKTEFKELLARIKEVNLLREPDEN